MKKTGVNQESSVRMKILFAREFAYKMDGTIFCATWQSIT